MLMVSINSGNVKCFGLNVTGLMQKKKWNIYAIMLIAFFVLSLFQPRVDQFGWLK